MLALSGGGLILYQAYGNLYAMTGRKAHLLEDKQILSVGIFDEVSFIYFFELGGARRRMTWRHIILTLGLHSEEEMAELGFRAYWFGSKRVIFDKGDIRDYWIEISFDRDFLEPTPSYGVEKVTEVDLFYLWTMDRGTDNVPYLLAQYLFHYSEGRKSGARELSVIYLHELARLNIYGRFGDTWAWVDPMPERQQVAMAGAPEGAPAANEGAQAILVPMQEPYDDLALRKIDDMVYSEKRHVLNSYENQIDMVKNELRNEMKTSIQTSLSNQTNEIKNMMASLLQMNTASTSGSGTLPGNTIANLKGELKAITSRSGLVTDGPTVPNPPKSVNPEEDECVEETYTDPDLAEYTIKVPQPPPVQKPKPLIQRNFVLHTRDSLLPHIPINLMPLSVWKKLGLPDLIPTRMTLELANRAICTPDGITRDVFVPIGKFTFPTDFVVVDYESAPRVPLILGRQFLRTARALIDVYGKEMILLDGDERLTLNMKHDTSSYSNHPHRDSINLINIFNLSSEDCLEDLVSYKQSDNPTFSLHKKIASPKFDDDPLSGSTTYLANSLLEEFTDELALITYPPDYDDNHSCDIESDLREIEFFLYQCEDSDFKDSIDQSDLTNLDDLFVYPTPEMFIDEQPPDYSFPPRFDVYPDDFLEIESDSNNFDDDLFDSKGEKIKEAELLIYQPDLP
nr:reverse transcriptase domain-containing protein [Tanacetum cinerariifolium]